MNNLLNKKCVSCEGKGIKPFDKKEALDYLALTIDWNISDDFKFIFKEYEFKDFKEAMTFVNKVATIAESEGHHPDIHIFFNKVTLELTTHAIGGLSENDFIVSAKVDRV